jgi:hypothetical protein
MGGGHEVSFRAGFGAVTSGRIRKAANTLRNRRVGEPVEVGKKLG